MPGVTDSYRPNFGSGRPPPPMPDSVREAMFSFNGVQRNPGNSAGRFERDTRNRNRRGGPPRYSRPRRTASSRPLLTQSQHQEERILRDMSAADKFRNLEDITDSEEDDMSESDEDDEDGRPTKKAKTDADDPSVASVPKWCNPDPYTALPPVAEGTGKRTDVLKLIRKAKIGDSVKAKDEMKENADFISFGDFDDEEEADEVLLAAPNGPRSHGALNEVSQFDGTGNESLGRRKRGEEAAIPRPPGGYLPSDQLVLPQWTATTPSEAPPWFQRQDMQDSAGIALHKEVIDFYEWVKPQEYEREVRSDVVHRLGLALNRIEPGELKAFGSYAAGLYLPIGDMDLVYLTRGFRPGNILPNGLPPKPPRKMLERYASFLRNSNIAKPGSLLLIPHAKVPIIKYVDARSGLCVDLSFNNDSGITAVDTFQAWKALHAPMPILVSVIKQFLMIRGLNDVSTGGLGGFSIICLVTSLLQHMPGTGPTANIGQMLVEFFNLYGYLLDRETVAVRMDPPGYIDKASYKPMLFTKEKRNRLTIIDPNRPENNISGGSHLVGKIIDAFAQAHDLLLDRLNAYDAGDTNISFLQDLVGGNFVSFEQQRTRLADLYFGLTGHEAPSYNPPSRTQSTSVSERRAERLKAARPELASQIRRTISVKEAVRIGGYLDGDALSKDIEQKLNPKKPKNKD